MKRLSVLIVVAFATFASVSSAPHTISSVPNVQLANRHRYTSNPDGILSVEAVRAIDKACDSLRTMGKAQVSVVALQDIAEDDVFTFAHSLFSKWGVGNKQSDNGLGILLVLDKREIRFVTGEGLEGVLPDIICKRIQQNYMVKPLGEGNYDKGMVDGVAAVATLLSSGELPAPGDEMSREETIVILSTVFGLTLIFILLFFFVYRAAHKCPRCGKYHIQQINSQILQDAKVYQVVAKTFSCPDCGNTFVRNVRIDKVPTVIVGGGRGPGGGFGGGGFGGGSFGGGGAGSRF